MSLRAILWALEDAVVSDQAERLVLIALADGAAKDGTGACLSVGTIAEYAVCSKRTVQYVLLRLQKAGLIRLGDQAVAARYGRYAPKVYDLPVGGSYAEPIFDQIASSQAGSDADSAPLKNRPVDNPARGATRGAESGRLGVQPVADKPTTKPTTNRGTDLGGVSHQAREAEKPTPKFPPNHDEHGPLSAQCPRHAGSPEDVPCWDCAAVKPEWQAAENRRANAHARAKALVVRQARDGEAGPPASPETIAEARAVARAARRAVPDEEHRRAAFRAEQAVSASTTRSNQREAVA
jgi:hypothetical protein